MKIEEFNEACAYKYTPFTTGIDVIDNINGIGSDDFIVMAGGTGTGKSYLGMSIGLNVAKNGKKVLYINYETRPHVFAERIIDLGFKMSTDFGEKNSDGRTRFMSAHRHNIGYMTIDMIESWVDKLRPDLLIIDLFSWLYDPKDHIPSVTRELAYRLSSFFKKYNCATIVLDQFIKGDKSTRATEDDIRGSTWLGQIATKIFVLYSYYDANPYIHVNNRNHLVENTMELIVRKDGLGRIKKGFFALYRGAGYRGLVDQEKEEYCNIVFKR